MTLLLALPMNASDTEKLEVAYDLLGACVKHDFYEWFAAKLVITKYLKNECISHLDINY